MEQNNFEREDYLVREAARLIYYWSGLLTGLTLPIISLLISWLIDTLAVPDDHKGRFLEGTKRAHVILLILLGVGVILYFIFYLIIKSI